MSQAVGDPFAASPSARHVGVGQQGEKLITGLAGEERVLADDVTQFDGCATQHLVADVVAMAVVDLLEVVQIDEQQYGDPADLRARR